ncbi:MULTISPECIES: BMP family ABC transporter substrate-binding protein [Brevibacillus]|jgi:transcriptional activator of comK gene|uniref:BMP family ABC transporter substrate-binding protein n=1 Tax=Brevibacillus TaxID=55080 RepID=UPI00156BCF1F|nr:MULTISPECIES: BMP family ABC transporter substrate-binding protein [Brevibacillus]MDH6350653.1 transcriptional activator of comK gene [Brevibacillus sp. 1238]NRQ54065.1 BMP family ABC transporter substrate-binding protein [Brevibacillus sp. HD1.4A]UED68318.1 BMP family ABC transporter substrate-binding protein [Brevibacillus sp. HD3.3A]
MPKLKPFFALFTFLVVGLLLLITSQFFTSMKHLDEVINDRGPSSEILRVALLLEGPTYDQGWNSSAMESITEMQKRFGFSLEIANNIKADQITNVAQKYAANDYDLILGHGVIFSEPFTSVARKYPQTRFISFNGEAPHSNQTTIRYDMKPAGQLVGMLAAKMSRTGKVGYILVDKPPEMAQAEGFRAGVKKAAPNAEIVIGKVSDFNDIENAVQKTREMIAHGVDVIYTTGDSFNLAVITEAQRSKVYTIGYIADQRYIAPDYVLASLVQDVRQCYRIIFEQYMADRLPSGKVVYGLAEGVNHFSPFGPMVPPEVRADIERELQHFISSRGSFGG